LARVEARMSIECVDIYGSIFGKISTECHAVLLCLKVRLLFGKDIAKPGKRTENTSFLKPTNLVQFLP